MGGPGSGPKKGSRKHAGGRPAKLTPEVHEQMVKLIEAGNYVETAAACCGIARTTYRNWIRWGTREKSGKYSRFASAIRKAEGLAEARALVRIRQAGQKWWQAEAWYLERKYPDRWGRYDRGTENQPAIVDETRRAIRDKETRDLLDRVSRRLLLASNPSSDGSETE